MNNRLDNKRNQKGNVQGKGRYTPPVARSYRERGPYTSLSIKGFRIFDELNLEDFSDINLFFGPNNSGKTSILEAIYTHASGLNFTPFQSQVTLRRHDGNFLGALDVGEKLISVFRDVSSIPYNFTISARVEEESSNNTLLATFSPSSELSDLDPRNIGQFAGGFALEPQMDNSKRSVQNRADTNKLPSIFLGRWETTLNGRKSAQDILFPISNITTMSPFKLANMHDILSHRHPEADVRVFSSLKRYDILDEFVNAMGSAYPDITGIDMIPYPDGTPGPVYAQTSGERKIPLYAFGDGMRRWFYLLGHMLVYRNACHCIEEIDATFHPGAHHNLSRLLVQYAQRFNNQIFATSHSIEFADAFLEALYGNNGIVSLNDKDPVRIFTIKRSKEGKIETWSLDGREAHSKRSLYDLELR